MDRVVVESFFFSRASHAYPSIVVHGRQTSKFERLGGALSSAASSVARSRASKIRQPIRVWSIGLIANG